MFPSTAFPPLPYKVDTSRPSLRTNWTRLVHPSTAPKSERSRKILERKALRRAPRRGRLRYKRFKAWWHRTDTLFKDARRIQSKFGSGIAL